MDFYKITKKNVAIACYYFYAAIRGIGCFGWRQRYRAIYLYAFLKPEYYQYYVHIRYIRLLPWC